jgi:DNA-binding transcriptional regulator YdaS (Cro superfamily)
MEPTKSNEALASAIAQYPSLKAFALELDVPYQTVQQWMKNGVPAEYCPQIEKMTGGEALCEDLNSRVDWTYLRATPKPAKSRSARKPTKPRAAPP